MLIPKKQTRGSSAVKKPIVRFRHAPRSPASFTSLLALLVPLLTVAFAPIANATAAAFDILNNDRLRFGNGSEDSANTKGSLYSPSVVTRPLPLGAR